MSKTVVDEESGKEEIMYSAEELEAAKNAEIDRLKTEHEKALLDKDEHVKKKLEEFNQGKSAQELKDIERDRKIEEANRIASEATEGLKTAEGRRINSLKEIAREKFTGNDPELNKKFEESWGLVNLEIKEDADIVRKAELVANMSGLNNNGDDGMGGMPMNGGYAPNFKREDTEKSKADHDTFKKALGLDSFIDEMKPPEAAK